MKKVLVILALLVSSAAFSQKIKGGVKAGVNISNFTGTDFGSVKKSGLFGVHAGGYMNFAIKMFSIQPEVLVSTQGAKLDSINGGGNYRLTYLSVPVMLRHRSATGFVAELGPQVGFKLSENIGNSVLKEFAKNLDFSIAAGLGYQLKSGLGVNARYILGLSKLGDLSSLSINPNYKQSIVQVSLAIPLTK